MYMCILIYSPCFPCTYLQRTIKHCRVFLYVTFLSCLFNDEAKTTACHATPRASRPAICFDRKQRVQNLFYAKISRLASYRTAFVSRNTCLQYCMMDIIIQQSVLCRDIERAVDPNKKPPPSAYRFCHRVRQFKHLCSKKWQRLG